MVKSFYLLFVLASCISTKQIQNSSRTTHNTAEQKQSAQISKDSVSSGLMNKSIKIINEYALNVQDLGVTPKNKKNNAALLQAYINKLPEGATDQIYIPAGEYYFEHAITLIRRPLRIFGQSGTIWGNSTKLNFPKNSDGIKIDRKGASIQETIIERVCLIGSGGDGSNGNGIYTNARVKLRDVTLKGFSQNGLLIWANMEEGGDASGSSIEYCHSLENGHDGFLAGRTDANAITFIGCDARDNGRYGFNDDSFLGNNFFSCMAHYNKKGDYHVRDWGNARSLFIGCYSEGGNVVSSLGPLTTVIGGIWGTAYKLGNK